VAKPLEFTISTLLLELVQVTVEERSCVLPSENVPVAVNWLLEPLGMLGGLAGVMAIELSVALVVVVVKVLVIPFTVTVIVLVPGATPVIRPLLLTVTADVLEELKVALVVRTCVVPSENVPVTVTCALVPAATLGELGLKEIETSVAGVTEKLEVEAVLPPKVAVNCAVPTPFPVARPLASIETTLALELDQVADADRS
jgi:hypothetical protein